MFEIDRRNVFGQSFGKNFTASKLKILFPVVNGVEICQIDVKPADAAIVIAVPDKHGLKAEKLYVRSGNSSPEMPLSEVQAFLSKRFGEIGRGRVGTECVRTCRSRWSPSHKEKKTHIKQTS